jgi:uracil-DNA glycosylase family 4
MMAKELWQQYNNLLNDFVDLLYHGGERQEHAPLTKTLSMLKEKNPLIVPKALLPQAVSIFPNDSLTFFQNTLADEPLLNRGYGRPWCGQGKLNPKVMVITLAPMADDVWLASEVDDYLTKWLQAIQIDRTECYHTSFFRLADTSTMVRSTLFIKLCYELIIREIRLVNPQVLLICGAETARHVMQNQLSLASMSAVYLTVEHYPVVVTHDPVAVLKNQSYRRVVWQDLTRLAKQLEA